MKVIRLNQKDNKTSIRSIVQKCIDEFTGHDRPRLRFLKNNPANQVFGGFVA